MNKHTGHNMPKWLLIICIGAPLLGLTMWLLLPGANNSILKLLPYALFLLCPLSHILMMSMMHRSNGHDHVQDGAQVKENESKEQSSCH